LISERRGRVDAEAAVCGEGGKQARALKVGREFPPQIAMTDMRIAGERVHHIETNIQTRLANSLGEITSGASFIRADFHELGGLAPAPPDRKFIDVVEVEPAFD